MPSEESDSIILHRFCNRHADKIGKELLSTPNTSADGDASLHGKQAWDGLCTLLVDLGQPFDVPRPSRLRSAEHEEYNTLMSRYDGRDTTGLQDLFFEVSQPSVSQIQSQAWSCLLIRPIQARHQPAFYPPTLKTGFGNT